MLNFLGKLYDILFGRWLYSDELGNYLQGFGLIGEIPLYLNKYILFWFIALFVGEFVSFLYYRVLDSPSWASIVKWILLGLGSSVFVMFCTAFVLWIQWRTKGTLLSNMSYLPEGEQVIGVSDLFGAGFAQFLLTFIFYVLCSLLLKRTSKNCSKIPY